LALGKALLILLAIAVPIFGIWWLIRRGRISATLTLGTPGAPASVPTPNPAASNTSAVESMVSKATGVPIAAIGKIASDSPLAVKAIFATTVGVTSVVHGLLTNPKAEVKSIAKGTVTAAKTTAKVGVAATKIGLGIAAAPITVPVKLVTHPVTTVKNAAKTVGNATKSVAKGATSAVKSAGNAAKSVVSSISHLF
jgi:hypothetical protein